ncbi:MAG: RagB/SusD family nutrient uptake outer membrane protein [Flavicella sp.]
MKQITHTYIILILSLFFATSCVDLETTNFNQKDTDTFFNTESDIAAGIVVVYDALAKGPYEFNTTNNLSGSVYDVPTILMGSGTHVAWDTREHGNNAFSSQTKILETMYTGSYFGISKANLVLEKIEEVEMSEEARNKYIAETRFLRGLFYFNLVQYFGGVPIIEKTYDYNYETSVVARSSIREVYDFIVADFEFAEQYLDAHDFDGDFATGRATALAASGLLAKVWLTRAGHPLNDTKVYKDKTPYELAKEYAMKVVDSGVFQLEDDYGKIFTSDNENNREWLFSVQFGPLDNDKGNWGGWHNTKSTAYNDPYGVGYGRVYLTEEMIDAWNEEDPRRKYIVKSLKSNGKDEKFKHRWGTKKFRFSEDTPAKNQSSINAPVLRLADIYLVIAEVENELNSGPTSLAFEMINLVRERARKGMPSDIDIDNIASEFPMDLVGDEAEWADYNSFKESIIWERARELCMEGLDRFDLNRSGRYMELTQDAAHLKSNGGKGNGFDPLPHHVLMPLPLISLRNNPAITENNPGY